MIYSPVLNRTFYAQHKKYYGAKHAFELRTINCYELEYLINDDTCHLMLDGLNHELQGDCVLFRRPGQINQSFMPYESIILCFDLKDPSGQELLDAIPTFNKRLNQLEYRQFFEGIFKESLLKRPYYPEYFSAKITELLYCLHNESLSMINNRPKMATDDTLVSILRYIDGNIERAFTIKEMSLELSVSERHIYNLFKKHIQTTPIKYINECRLNYAGQLLKRSNLPVHRIANMCGYENTNYFITLFHKYQKMTPLQYRKS